MTNWVLKLVSDITSGVELSASVPLLPSDVLFSPIHLMSHQALLAFGATRIPSLKVGVLALPLLKRRKVEEDQCMSSSRTAVFASCGAEQ